MTCTHRDSLPPARPQFTHHMLTGETELEMPVVFADRTASITLWLDGDPARRPVQVEDMGLSDDMPTSRVAGLLYAALGIIWQWQMAANERGDTRGACFWTNIYDSIFAFRGAWIDEAGVDLAPASRRPEGAPSSQPVPLVL